MNRIKFKIKKYFKKAKKQLRLIKENHLIDKYIKGNALFIAFIVVNVLNATLLRFFCIHSLSNYLSLRAIISDAMVVVLIGAFAYLFKPKNRFTYFMSITIFLTLICIINSIYYTFYTSFASLSMIALVKYVTQVGDAVTENVFQIKDIVYIIAPIILFIFNKKLIKKNYYKKIEIKSVRRKKLISAFTIGGVLLFLFFITMKPLDVSRFVKQWNKEYIVMRFGIYIYQGNDIVTSLQPKINSMFGYDQAKKEFNDYFEGKQKGPDNEYTNIFKGKNILVIHGESMMTNAMSLKFNDQEVTPNLNKMASEGMFFSNYYSQVSVGTSSDTELTSLTSLMPTIELIYHL